MMNHPVIAKQRKQQEQQIRQLKEFNGEGKLKLGVCFRELSFNRESIDVEKRTVKLSFSSEEPYERWFGMEILGHDASEVRLSRMDDGAPLLFNHDRDAHLGIVEEVKLENNHGQSVVRFGNSALASEKFQDVQDGILQKVSVGYIVHKAVLVEENKDGQDIYRMTDWEPMENSLVTIPADNTVGVGRSAEFIDSLQREFESFETTVDVSMRQHEAEPEKPIKPKTPTIEVKEMPDEVITKEQIEAAQKQYGNAEANRIREISAIGHQYQETCPAVFKAVQAAIKDHSVSAGDFAIKALDMVSKIDPLDLKPASHLDMGSKDLKKYSITRAIHALVTKDWSGAGLEYECNKEIADKLDRMPQGFLMPYDVQTRVMTSGGAATGTELVGTEHMPGSFIDNLRAQAILARMGAVTLPGLVGNIDIPKKTGSAAFSFNAEDSASGDTDLATGTLSLSPKILSGGVAMSRSLLKQSTPEVEAMAMADLSIGAALGIDNAGFNGSGAANNPTGIINTTGVLTQTVVAAGAPTWKEVVGFETAVAGANGLGLNPYYAATPGVRGNLKTTSKDAGSGRFLMEGTQANGYGVDVTTQLAANSIVFGDYTQMLIAMWGIIDIMHDTATKAASGGLVIRVFADIDVGVRQPTAFCKNA